jgi:hypothetical protein
MRGTVWTYLLIEFAALVGLWVWAGLLAASPRAPRGAGRLRQLLLAGWIPAPLLATIGLRAAYSALRSDDPAHRAARVAAGLRWAMAGVIEGAAWLALAALILGALAIAWRNPSRAT